MIVRNQQRIRVAAAWLCLLAVAVLYAPLGAAALLANGVGCCGSAYCPVKSHHHHKQQAAAQEESPMDCGHDMGMTACSMSCCQDSARPAVIPNAFVLPEAVFVPAADEAIRPVHMTRAPEISQLRKPLSPPPRLASSVL